MIRKLFSGLGVRFCAAYLAIYYIAPLIFGYLFDYSYLESYKGTPEYIYVLPAVLAYFLIFILLHNGTPEIVTPLRRVHIRTFSRPYLNMAIMVIFLYLAVKFYLQYGLKYRHSGDLLSESDGYVIILTCLKYYFTLFLLLKIADLSFDLKIGKVDTVNIIVGAVAFYFATSAAFDMLRILVALLILWYIFTNINFFLKNFQKFKLIRTFMILIVISIGFFSILFIGLANKMGIEVAYDLITGGTILDFFLIPIARLSIHFYSLSYHLTYTLFSFDFQMQTIPNVIQNLNFRVSHLIGSEAVKPDIVSSARLNSLSIYLDPRDRNGASPGLIGSIFFIPFFPFSALISVLYVSFIYRKIESLFNKNKKYSLMTVLYVVALAQVYTDAQVDLLNFIGVSGVSLLFLYMAWFDRPEFRKHIYAV